MNRLRALGVEGVLLAVLAGMLWLALGTSALKATHDFHQYIDRSIHVTVDDGEANISYALATDGRYGFMSSPVLVGMDRSRAQFNYGPWYFYLAAGVIWLFGFSISTLRALHLWGILGFIGAAALWFRGRHQAATTALFGLGLLYCFEASHWPMMRPDILVSAFAVLFVIGAGRGWHDSRSRDWFMAGLAATCGAFTHLIAASLVPSAIAVFVLAVLFGPDRDQPERWRRVRLQAIALVGGIAVGLVMFYASFGFDLATQRRFFAAYREVTASQTAFLDVIGNHLAVAFGYLGSSAPWMVGGVWLFGALGAVAALWIDRDRARLVHARLVPPLMVWTAYTVSNGFYTNYHQGYAILSQVMWLWTAASLLWVALELTDRRSLRVGAIASALAMVALLTQANWIVRQQFAETSWKMVRTATWAPFSEYSERVLQSIPARATAWGSVVFGMEAPHRIQLVQWADAVSIFPQVAPAERDALAPEYVIFGYAEARDNMMSALKGGETLLDRTAVRLPSAQFRLVSLVAATPYGVTRTYARSLNPLGERGLPQISVYDAEHREWLTRIGPQLPVTFTPSAPVALRIGYEAEPAESRPTNSVIGELPAGRYLLKAAVKPGEGRSPRRLIAATSAGMLRQTIGEMGPDGDFAAYLAHDRDVTLVLVHQGGPVYVSQFDDGTAPAIEGIVVHPILGFLDADEYPNQWKPLPLLNAWKTAPGLAFEVAQDTVRVSGDASVSGYQYSSPTVRERRQNRVTVRVPLRVEQGDVCAGVLNGDDSSWLLAPSASRDSLQFVVDQTQGFRVVLANCKSKESPTTSRFVVWPGSYYVEPSAEYYVDRLITAALYPNALRPRELAGPEVRLLPSGIEVSKADADSPITNFTAQELSYRAPNVRQDGQVWIANGQAEGPYSYLIQSAPIRMDGDSRVLVSGRVEHGGITLGLQRNNEWAGQINITEPGEFTAVIAPPGRGTYSVVVANNLSKPDDLATSIVFSRFGMLRK
ncbi:MAG TPA: hypothetical protein VNT81_05610 [Vicinamibacterales bacterium]|nr:hypothetical protein [Vicinamibacterales bacterium]